MPSRPELYQLNDPSPSQRATYEFVDRLFTGHDRLSRGSDDALEFGGFIFKSWRGIGKSLGL
jgi:hypothetical protein